MAEPSSQTTPKHGYITVTDFQPTPTNNGPTTFHMFDRVRLKPHIIKRYNFGRFQKQMTSEGIIVDLPGCNPQHPKRYAILFGDSHPAYFDEDEILLVSRPSKLRLKCRPSKK